MQIIFNNAVCESITGRIRTKSPWRIRGRNGRYFALYRGPKDATVKHQTFAVFYRDLCRMEQAGYVKEIIVTDCERRMLAL